MKHIINEKPGEAAGRDSIEIPVEIDSDWEYTGVVYACPDCGFTFEEYPPDLDLCPACGADVWQDEN